MSCSSRRSTTRRARRSHAPASGSGFGQVTGVRQGKRFELELAGPGGPAAVEQIAELAAELLANPVIEEFEIHAP